jgi:hypothetical protein
MSDTEHQLRRQTEAARDLLADLRGEGLDEDAEFREDMVEGETDIHAAIAAALTEIDEAEVLILGGKAKIEQIAGRVAMEEKRVERVRALIERAMVTLDLPTLRLPTATLSVAKRKPGLIVTDESAIPSRFFVQPDPPAPRLDKKALLAALNDNEAIPGAGLDNGTVSLTVRRK